MSVPPTTFDPKTSQYCAPVIIYPEELVHEPWHVAYFDVDAAGSGRASINVTEIIAPTGQRVDLDAVDLEWVTEQCIDALAVASCDDNLIYKIRDA